MSNPVPVDDADTVLFRALHVAILLELASYVRGLKWLASAEAMSDMAWRNARALGALMLVECNLRDGEIRVSDYIIIRLVMGFRTCKYMGVGAAWALFTVSNKRIASVVFVWCRNKTWR